MIQLHDDTFDSKVSEKGILFARFTAEWCGPCRALKPIIAEVAAEFDDDVQFAEINVDNCPKLVEKYSVNSIPTTLIFKDGTLTHTIKGPKARSYFNELLKSIINPA